MPDSRSPNERGYRIVELDEVDSTNAEAMRRAADGERGPLWITAVRQTSGRGRSGRVWETPAGNLAATLLFAPDCDPSELYQLSLVTGVAVHAAIAPLLIGSPAPPLRLKWPNDILLGRDKVGGILIESSSFGARSMAAIGIGINIVTAPALPDRSTASLRDALMSQDAVVPRPRDILTMIAAQMEDWLSVWQTGRPNGAGFALIRAAWLERAGQIGEPISVKTGADIATGLFVGIDETGALLLQGHDGAHESTQVQVRRFTFGDVYLTPLAAAKEKNK